MYLWGHFCWQIWSGPFLRPPLWPPWDWSVVPLHRLSSLQGTTNHNSWTEWPLKNRTKPHLTHKWKLIAGVLSTHWYSSQNIDFVLLRCLHYTDAIVNSSTSFQRSCKNQNIPLFVCWPWADTGTQEQNLIVCCPGPLVVGLWTWAHRFPILQLPTPACSFVWNTFVFHGMPNQTNISRQNTDNCTCMWRNVGEPNHNREITGNILWPTLAAWAHSSLKQHKKHVLLVHTESLVSGCENLWSVLLPFRAIRI